MTVLSDVYVTPNRVCALLRFLLKQQDLCRARGELETAMMPTSLVLSDEGDRARPKRNMIRGVMNECIEMGLIMEEEGIVSIASSIMKKEKGAEEIEQRLPSILTSLLFSSGNDRNHDLGGVIGWYLSQDIYSAPGNWEEIEEALRVQRLKTKVPLNDANMRNFVPWSIYLGLACMIHKQDNSVLLPDPTAYIMHELTSIFQKSASKLIPIREITDMLADRCPVLEQGFLRNEVEKAPKLSREKNELSVTTAFAWLRLQDAGIVQFSMHSDAPAMMLPTQTGGEQYSHVALLRHADKGV